MLYKGLVCEKVIESGNIEMIEGMYNSVNCKKSRNRMDEKVVKECDIVLEKIKKWKEDNGLMKGGKRGKYENVKIEELNDVELSGMYESLYSRRCYYVKVGNNKKVNEIEGRIEYVKKERIKRKVLEMERML